MELLLSFLAGGGFLVGIFAAALLLGGTRGNRGANRLLALLLAVSSFNIIHPLFSVLGRGTSFFRDSTLAEPLQFLMAPLIAAYVRRLLEPRARLGIRDLPHLLPFVAVILYSLSPAPGLLGRAVAFPVSAAALWTLLLAQVCLYLVPAFKALHRYTEALREQVSNMAGIDLGWLRWFMHVILWLYLTFLVILVSVVHSVPLLHVRPFLSLALAAYVCAVAYRGILQKEPPRLEPLSGAPAGEAGKYARGSVAPGEALALQRKLESIMESGKLYLDPELDLSGLAEKVGAARNQLSYVINQNLGRNFYDFVNEYRVREVLRLMEDPGRANDKVITLAFDAGFNSKPTFNAVFKKLTGHTPSDYRRREKNQV
jgi:AraC-like DNA-binding protein